MAVNGLFRQVAVSQRKYGQVTLPCLTTQNYIATSDEWKTMQIMPSLQDMGIECMNVPSEHAHSAKFVNVKVKTVEYLIYHTQAEANIQNIPAPGADCCSMSLHQCTLPAIAKHG